MKPIRRLSPRHLFFLLAGFLPSSSVPSASGALAQTRRRFPVQAPQLVHVLRTRAVAAISAYGPLAIVLVVGALFRLAGLGWDQGYLFQPDERQILFVTSHLQLPAGVLAFFSPDSPLNPKFFAYGSFPIYLLRILGVFAPANPFSVPWNDPQLVSLALLGRFLSAAFDLGTIALIYLLGRRLYSARVGLGAALCVAVTVLEIQLSHFYAVDTLLTFLVVATIFFAARFARSRRRRDLVLMSLCFGLAMATKVTALPLVVPIAVAVTHATTYAVEHEGKRAGIRAYMARVLSARGSLIEAGGIALAVFIITQPYAVLDPVRYVNQVGTEWLVARGWLDYPYTRQYAGTVPFVYQIVQSSIWGMGLPLGVIAWAGSAAFAWRWWRRRDWREGLILSWAVVYFLMIGVQYSKYLRYLAPLQPFLLLMSAAMVGAVIRSAVMRKPLLRFTLYSFLAIIALSAFLYSLAFTSIYSQVHPWLRVSDWMYQNIPAGSSIATEHWDEALPESLRSGVTARSPTEYKVAVLPMYDPDNEIKLHTIVDTLERSEYVVLASPRLYSPIARLPNRYPISSRYYHLLFDGSLGFDLVAVSRNAPSIAGITIRDDPLAYAGLDTPPLLGSADAGSVVWNWGHADESFTVYDQPMPLVFRKIRTIPPARLTVLLSPP